MVGETLPASSGRNPSGAGAPSRAHGKWLRLRPVRHHGATECPCSPGRWVSSLGHDGAVAVPSNPPRYEAEGRAKHDWFPVGSQSGFASSPNTWSMFPCFLDQTIPMRSYQKACWTG